MSKFFEMFISANIKIRAFWQSIMHGGIFFGVTVLLWFVDKAYFDNNMIPLDSLLLFLLPYYALWVVIMTTSIIHRGETFKIIWIATFFDEETYSSKNAPYAFSFLGVSLIILIIQLL